ncbi:MAG: helix-turn-helix domain-containing protein [Pirellula sp.]
MNDSSEDMVWRALADPVRRRILDDLSKSALTTGELITRCDRLCRTAVMKHLDVLVKADLVLVRRKGRVRWNFINPAPIERVLGRWVHQHVQHIAASLNRLKDVVEAKPFAIDSSKGKQKCRKTK